MSTPVRRSTASAETVTSDQTDQESYMDAYGDNLNITAAAAKNQIQPASQPKTSANAAGKTKANAQKELFMTGGGAAPKHKENSNPVLGQLNNVMVVSVDSLPARHDDDQITSTTDIDDEELVDIVDENGAIIRKILFRDIIVDERETEIGRNENEAVENNTDVPPLHWSKCRPTILRTKKNELLKTSKASKNKLETSGNLVALNKQILEQQLEHSRLEHEQLMMHSAEEHKLRMQILEAELKSKQM